MIIAIDGSIGSGKSSVLSYLTSGTNAYVYPEPVEKWTPLLEDLYNDLPGSAFRMQTQVWMDRCLAAPPAGITYMERSPLFQWNCFVCGNEQRVTGRCGGITAAEKDILSQMYVHTGDNWRPDVYIYLRCPPAQCMERIRRRNRRAEQKVDMAYLEELHRRHEQTFAMAREHDLPIYAVDASDGRSIGDITAEVLLAVEEATREYEMPPRCIPVPEPLVYNTFQMLDWIAQWNREDDDYNPPVAMCKEISTELRSIWTSKRDLHDANI